MLFEVGGYNAVNIIILPEFYFMPDHSGRFRNSDITLFDPFRGIGMLFLSGCGQSAP